MDPIANGTRVKVTNAKGEKTLGIIDHVDMIANDKSDESAGTVKSYRVRLDTGGIEEFPADKVEMTLENKLP